MNNLNARCPYASEPLAQRLIWGLFLLGGIALALIVAGAKDLQNGPDHWYVAVPRIALGVAFFVSRRVRQFAWAFFGLFLLWFILASAVLFQFLDPAQPIPSWQLRVCVIILYVLPPLIGAAIIHYARNRAAHCGLRENP